MILAAGTQLGGRYRIVRVVGEGSMGTVYEAEHVRIARRVAVKVLHLRYSRNERAVARFIREARAAGSVGHGNIVEATDFGVHQGQPYFVMELLRGEELARRLEHQRVFEPGAACRIVGQVLSALASTHAAGIVHRDLKPENIFLVSGRYGKDTVKLLDFGLSKFRRSDGTSMLETQDGVMMGTPAYMAPEQWMGRRDIDHRADLFSVGVVLYELLTGRLPYQGETQGELFQEIVNGTATPPAPSAVREGVPEALDPIVLRAIARDRDARFQTAQAFLEALRPFGAEGIEVVDSPPASSPVEETEETRPLSAWRTTYGDVRPRGWVRVWMVGGVVLAALLAAGGVALLRRERGPVSRAAPSPTVRGALAPPVRPSPTPTPPPADVRIELRGLPADARVRLDGLLQPEGSVLEVPRGDRPRTLEVQAGAVRRAIEIRPDRDQVIVVELGGAAVARAVRDAGAPATEHARRGTRQPRGIGAINVTHEF